MSIEVNNNEVEWIKDETVTQLLKRMRFTFPLVVVKINGEVIPRNDFSNVIIPDDAQVAVIHMISGG